MIWSKAKKVEIRAQLSMTRISGGRPQGDNRPDGFRLTIEDVASRCMLAQIEIDVEAFANLLSARMTTDAVPAVVYLSDRIGMVHQNKTVWHVIPSGRKTEQSDAAMLQEVAAVVAKENPGWEVDDPGAWNMHRRRTTKAAPRMVPRGEPVHEYSFTLRRWVTAEVAAAEPQEPPTL